MKVRFTTRALSQIEVALGYVAKRSPQAAATIRDRLSEITTLLEAHLRAGHFTTRAGVRRLAMVPYPYLIDYRLRADQVIVMRFRHAARKPSA